MKFFVSYSRSVKSEVGKVISLLKAAGHEIWWDGDIPLMADWWATILDRIEWGDVFLFVISEKSVESEYCLTELKYATDRNRPILPFVIDDHTSYTIPPEVTPMRAQWFIYDGDPARMLENINDACEKIRWEKHRDIYASRPAEPNTSLGSLTKQFQQARNFALNGDFENAKSLFRNVKTLDFNEWGQECVDWIKCLNLYSEIGELADDNSTHKRAFTKWKSFVSKYGTEFDPFKLNEKLTQASSSSSTILVTEKTLHDKVGANPNADFLDDWNSRVKAILPEPFEWCFVPEGQLASGKTLTLIPAFAIAKYPITNQQFDIFVNASDGYIIGEWWGFSKTAAGWRSRNISPQLSFSSDASSSMGNSSYLSNSGLSSRFTTTTPPTSSSQTSKKRKSNKEKEKHYPRTNINWFEAMAFCQWLSSKTDLKITLPLKIQWQRAAQGNDKRKYAWGNVIDTLRCNYLSSNMCEVTKYDFGSSPFGVLNMCGNVHEWIQPTTRKKTSYSYSKEEIGTACGGSFMSNPNDAMCSSIIQKEASRRENDVGFRIVLNLS